MDEYRKLTSQEKALRINLSKAIYGSFAEIGAGQEVAANFFKVGGASGTIAKTISAYDMKFSDAIYGVCDRYVCEDRLTQMLDHEYVLLAERLPHRIETTRFFAFADTVEILNYERTNQGHGWMGLRFQLNPLPATTIGNRHRGRKHDLRLYVHERTGRDFDVAGRWTHRKTC
jgi:hypothetical protein